MPILLKETKQCQIAKISEQSFADGSRKGGGATHFSELSVFVEISVFPVSVFVWMSFFLVGNVCSLVYVGVWSWMLLKRCRLCWMPTGERLYSQSHGPAVMLRARWWIGWLLSLPEFHFFSLPLSLFLTVPICLSPSFCFFLPRSWSLKWMLSTGWKLSLSHTQISWIFRGSLLEHILVHEEKPVLSFHRLSCWGTLEGEDKGGWAKHSVFTPVLQPGVQCTLQFYSRSDPSLPAETTRLD